METMRNIPTKIISYDPQSKQIISMAKQVAPTNINVTLCGEVGVGKKLLAHYIHYQSTRRQNALVLLDHYSFASQVSNNIALENFIQKLSGNTLVIEDACELSLAEQLKLVHLINNQQISNTRVIMVTQMDITQALLSGKIRQDFYYAINTFPICILPLRERIQDILPLANYLLSKQAKTLDRAQPSLTAEAEKLLQAHTWPGNSIEMMNELTRAMLLNDKNIIDAEDLDLTSEKAGEVYPHQENVLKTQEYELILKTLHETNGNRTVAAKQLHISPRTLRYKLAKMREQGIQC
jgi:two-component system response regulator FlrC